MHLSYDMHTQSNTIEVSNSLRLSIIVLYMSSEHDSMMSFALHRFLKTNRGVSYIRMVLIITLLITH